MPRKKLEDKQIHKILKEAEGGTKVAELSGSTE